MCVVCYGGDRSRDLSYIFFFNDTATTEIYTLSLHDALPISENINRRIVEAIKARMPWGLGRAMTMAREMSMAVHSSPDQCGSDRKSTRLNSSHANISYAVFCLKKKKTHI